LTRPPTPSVVTMKNTPRETIEGVLNSSIELYLNESHIGIQKTVPFLIMANKFDRVTMTYEEILDKLDL
jgi:hypothetical protein